MSRRVQFPLRCSRSGHVQVSGAADLANSSVKADPACNIVKNLVYNCNCLKPSSVSCLDVWAVCTEICGVITMLFFPFWNVPETSVLTHCFPSGYYTHHTWIKDHEKCVFHLIRHFLFKIHHTALMNLGLYNLNFNSGSLVLIHQNPIDLRRVEELMHHQFYSC